MSEVQSRSQAPPSRGRGGGRGGRGGFAARSEGRTGNTRHANGDKSTPAEPLDEDGDIVQLRQQHGDKLEMIKSIFPDWSDADILYALQENEGDVEVVVTKISEGGISQWGEVSKPKKTSKPKAKDATTSTSLNESSGNGRPVRGGRAEGGRGGRGARGSDRARGGRGRGASTQSATNGHQSKENQELSVPTDEAPAWGAAASTDDTTSNEWGTTGWGTTDAAKETTTTATPAQPTTKPTAPATTTEAVVAKAKTWASMLRQSTQPKSGPKSQEAAAPKPAESTESLPPAEPTPAEPEPVVEETPEETVEEPIPAPAPVEEEAPKAVEPEVALPPSEDDLTKNNLEQLPDESNPPATATAASTAADSWDPRQAAQSATATPLSAAQAQHQGQASRPTTSGFAATALKATERPVRLPSYQRRVLEQEEAVRLPGNREVDRAAVQFGAFSLSGAEDDVDGEREEPETRAQPPSDSPIQPRASLPPVAQPTQQAAIPEAFSSATTQKPATTLPQPAAATSVAPPTGPAAGSPAHQPFNQQYSRFGQANTQDQSAFPPKPYDNYSQQPAATSAAGFDSFPAPTTQAPSQQGGNAFSSAPSDYSSYYTADQHGRGSYNNSYYGQGYGQQQGGQGHNEGGNSHRQPFGGYNAAQNSDNLSQYPQSAAQQSRYGANSAADAHNSGHNTPNPTAPSQQPAAQSSGPQSNLHQQHQQGPAGGYPFQHPYQNSPFYSQYMNYYGQGSYGGYGGSPYGKGGAYGQPHQYQQSPYEHSSSPATSGFAQSTLAGRADSGLGSTIDNYGRAGSAQSGAPGLGNSGFGGAHDAFNRAGSSYQSQTGQGFGGPTAQGGSASDDLKPYGDSKATGGPSPSLAGGARPGSATNTPGQSGLPPPQSGAQGMGGYGAYPSHHQGHGAHGNQTGGSGFGQGHNNNNNYGGGGYGNYGNNQGFGGSYGGRGWGSNYQ